MQEEVENRTVNLAISTTKLTGRTIIAGIRKYLQHREKVKMKKARDPAVHSHELTPKEKEIWMLFDRVDVAELLARDAFAKGAYMLGAEDREIMLK